MNNYFTKISIISFNLFSKLRINILYFSNYIYKVLICKTCNQYMKDSDIENQNDIEDDYDRIDKKNIFNNNINIDINITDNYEKNSLLTNSNSLKNNNSIVSHNKYDDYSDVGLTLIDPEVFFNIGQSMIKCDYSTTNKIT